MESSAITCAKPKHLAKPGERGSSTDQSSLNNSWDNLVADPVAVALPVISIFRRTPFFVAKGAISEQDGEKDDIEIREGVTEKGGHGPEEGSQKLGDVVKVPADPPPTGSKQQVRFRLATFGDVVGFDQYRALAPHFAVTARGSHLLPLSIRHVVDENAHHTKDGDEGRQGPTQMVWMTH